jgi:hypothetical protein
MVDKGFRRHFENSFSLIFFLKSYLYTREKIILYHIISYLGPGSLQLAGHLMIFLQPLIVKTKNTDYSNGIG